MPSSGEHGGRDVEDGRLIEPRPRLHARAVQIDDAFDVMEALAHAAQVARLRGIVVELAEIEAVVGEHHQRGVVVERIHELAEQLVGEDVHLLDRVAVVLLLRRQLAAQLAGAEQVAEEMRRRVDALDVDHAEVGLLVSPEREADVAIAVRGRVRPLEVREVVLEVEWRRERLGAHVDEASQLFEFDVDRAAHQVCELLL